MNNITNGAASRAGSDQEENDFEARLNTYIYDFFVRSENYECARSLLRSRVPMEPQVRLREDMNGNDDSIHTDSKDDIDSKRPDDLPAAPFNSDNSFLLDWFSCFWDFFLARSKNTKASQQAIQYLQHTQTQTRLRQEQQQALLRSAPMMPANMGEYQNMQNMLRFQQGGGMVGMNGDLRQKALQNNRNGFGHPSQQQQLAQLAANSKQQMMAQQQMRRDPSDLDINGQRPRTPSSAENAPSPSKRPRLDGVTGFNGPQMMPNGRGPPQGLQGQQMMDHNETNSILMQHGINPTNLTQPQFNSFQNQTPAVQQKSIQVYTQNMAQQQRQNMPKPRIPGQGSPMMQAGMELAGTGPGTEYFNINPGMAMRAPVQTNGAGGNHALQDYQMQLMLLEQQNKKRLLMARQEHDSGPRPEGQQGMPGATGFAPVMSPQGSRSGPSPGPNDQIKRGTPKMGASVLPGGGSPMPDGSMPQGRESPAAMNYNSQMPQEVYQMKMEGMRPPPSSHPRFNQQPMTQEQMEAVRANQMGGGWAPQQRQAPMMPQIPQAQQPAQSTPQQRPMPPPTTLPAGATTNGRPASPAVPAPAPQTPSTTAKPNPKAKKNDEKTRKRPPKKTSGAGAAPTAAAPANEPENPPPTPTPQTPNTPMNANSFSKQNDTPNPASLVPGPISAATSAPFAQPQPDSNVAPFMNPDEPNAEYNIGNFSTDMGGDVLLEHFDFDSFLQSTDDGFNLPSTDDGFSFDQATLGMSSTDGVEAVAGDA